VSRPDRLTAADAGEGAATATPTSDDRVGTPATPSRSSSGWAVAAAVALFFLVPARALLRAPGPSMEEGFMLVFPMRVLDGAIPNKDFFYLYGPGSLWVLAAIYKAFGVTVTVERLYGLVQLAGLATGAALLVRWWGKWVAVAAVALSAIFVVPAIQLVAIPWTGGAALGLLSLGALVEARSRASARWATAGGVLAGVATLYRIDLGLAVVLGGAAALWGLDRALVRRAIVGLAAGLSPWLVHLVLAGPRNVWQGMLVDPMLRLRATRRLPVPPDPDELTGVARVFAAIDRWWPLPRLGPSQQLFAWFWLLVLLTLALLAIAIWTVGRAPHAFRPRVLLAASLFAVGAFPHAVQRADSAHFGWVSGVVIVFLPAALAELVSMRRPAWPVTRIGAATGVAVVLACALVLPSYTARRYIAIVQDAFDPPDAVEVANEGRSFYVAATEAEARSIDALLAAVAREVPRGSRVIVGNTDMRRVPYVDSFLYHLLPNLEPGTAFIEFEPGITNRRGTRLTEEMRRADVFIASDRWLGWDEPNDAMEPGDPGPALVLRSDFCLCEDFGNGYKLFLRCAH
jgi:hypothetical protein